MKITCIIWRRKLERAALSPSLEPETAGHLAVCDECRRCQAEIGALASELRATFPPKTAGEGLATAVRAQIAAEPLPAARRSPLGRRPVPALAAAALVVAAAGVSVWRPTGPRRPAFIRVPSRGPAVSADGGDHLLPGPLPPEKRRPAPQPGRDRLRPVQPQRWAGAGPAEAPAGPGVSRQQPPAPPVRVPDEQYLDGSDRKLLALWAGGDPQGDVVPAWLERRLPKLRDDFVQVPLPRLASRQPGDRALADAVRQYEKDASIIDSRLFRRVTLQLNGASLEELCADLERQTGVRISAAPSVRDEKVTVMVKAEPARDLMRSVARLFGYKWFRTGEEGAQKYQFTQDLRSRLTEEELRNRDVNEALLALDAEMAAYEPYLRMSLDQLRARMERAPEAEKKRLKALVEQGAWGGMQLYHRLTPSERVALLNGGEISLDAGAENADRRVPQEWIQPVLESVARPVTLRAQGVTFGSGTGRVADIPNAEPVIGIKLNRSEVGQFSLESTLQVRVRFDDGNTAFGLSNTLAVGRSPSVENPRNATLNAALKGQRPFDREVGCRPVASCPHLPRTGDTLPDHVTSGDVWEAIHRETGMPIVADYYTRLHPGRAVASEKGPLFDALCQAGDAMGVRWTKDGSYLIARSTSFLWDKLKEVPRRHLLKWQADRKDGVLPRDSFLEVAMLTDMQLGSRVTGRAIKHCWGLEEWSLLEGDENRLRPNARFLAGLTAQQRSQAEAPEGLPFLGMSAPQQQAFITLLPEDTRIALQAGGLGAAPGEPGGPDPASIVRSSRLRGVYVPRGYFTYAPPDREKLIIGPTEAAVTQSAGRTEPHVDPAHVQKSPGDLWMITIFGDGSISGNSRSMSWKRRPPTAPR